VAGSRIRVVGLDPVMSVDERRETEEGRRGTGFYRGAGSVWDGEVLRGKRMKRVG